MTGQIILLITMEQNLEKKTIHSRVSGPMCQIITCIPRLTPLCDRMFSRMESDSAILLRSHVIEKTNFIFVLCVPPAWGFYPGTTSLARRPTEIHFHIVTKGVCVTLQPPTVLVETPH